MDKERDFIPKFNAAIGEFEARQLNPLVLAFVGDSVHHTIVRSRLACSSSAKAGQLHVAASKEVKAAAQAQMFDRICKTLTEDELSVYKRARNSKMNTMAKNATSGDYKKASGFEALIGYLYLSGRHDRLRELYDAALGVENQRESDKT